MAHNMTRWVALLRGINVGGKNKIPMADLKALFLEQGFKDVTTYIQSGNVVFSADKFKANDLSSTMSEALLDRFGFKPQMMILSSDEIEEAIQECPFCKDVTTEKTLHFYFLSEEPLEPDLEKISQIKLPSEDYQLRGKIFYLSAPDGFGRSKLAANVEKHLGVAATVRNWRTVATINDLVHN